MSSGGRWPDAQLRASGVKARQVMAEFLADQAQGREWCWMPSPGAKMDAAYVDKNIANMQREWNTRWQANDRLFAKPDFQGASMGAKLCLLARLQRALRS